MVVELNNEQPVSEPVQKAILVSPRLLFRKTFAKVLVTIDSHIQVTECTGIHALGQLHMLPAVGDGLVLIDCATLGEISIVDQMLAIFSLQPEACLVVVLDEQDDASVDAAMNSGASGVLIKASPPQVMVDMLQTVLQGGRCRPSPTITITPEELPKAIRSQLSARQQKLFRLIAGGQSITATAATLGLTPTKVVTEMRVVLGIVRGRAF